MKRSLFLLLAGAYGVLLAASMLFFTESTLLNYGVPKVDVDHVSIAQFLGLSNGALGLLFLLNRDQPTSYPFRTILMVGALNPLGSVAVGLYHVLVLHVPFSTFFVADSLFRLALGLAFLYFHNQATREATGIEAVIPFES